MSPVGTSWLDDSTMTEFGCCIVSVKHKGGTELKVHVCRATPACMVSSYVLIYDVGHDTPASLPET